MKKYLTILLISAAAFTLAGCGDYVKYHSKSGEIETNSNDPDLKDIKYPGEFGHSVMTNCGGYNHFMQEVEKAKKNDVHKVVFDNCENNVTYIMTED